VRELEHAIERAAVLSDQEVLSPTDLQPDGAPAVSRPRVVTGLTLREASERAEREAIEDALRATGGNRREAARRLGVSLRTLFYKVRRYRVE
jgi:DNA-binding NtrC family response regulator